MDLPYLHNPRLFFGHFPQVSVWPPDQASGSLHPVLCTQPLIGYANILGGNKLANNHLTKGRDYKHSVQFSSVAQSCLTLCDPMDCSMPGFPVHQKLPEFAQTHAHRVDDAIQPSHPLSPPSPPSFNPSQHQGLFQWTSSLPQVAKILEFQLQHQSFQWIFRVDFLYDYKHRRWDFR